MWSPRRSVSMFDSLLVKFGYRQRSKSLRRVRTSPSLENLEVRQLLSGGISTVITTPKPVNVDAHVGSLAIEQARASSRLNAPLAHMVLTSPLGWRLSTD